MMYCHNCGTLKKQTLQCFCHKCGELQKKSIQTNNEGRQAIQNKFLCSPPQSPIPSITDRVADLGLKVGSYSSAPVKCISFADYNMNSHSAKEKLPHESETNESLLKQLQNENERFKKQLASNSQKIDSQASSLLQLDNLRDLFSKLEAENNENRTVIAKQETKLKELLSKVETSGADGSQQAYIQPSPEIMTENIFLKDEIKFLQQSLHTKTQNNRDLSLENGNLKTEIGKLQKKIRTLQRLTMPEFKKANMQDLLERVANNNDDDIFVDLTQEEEKVKGDKKKSQSQGEPQTQSQSQSQSHSHSHSQSQTKSNPIGYTSFEQQPRKVQTPAPKLTTSTVPSIKRKRLNFDNEDSSNFNENNNNNIGWSSGSASFDPKSCILLLFDTVEPHGSIIKLCSYNIERMRKFQRTTHNLFTNLRNYINSVIAHYDSSNSLCSDIFSLLLPVCETKRGLAKFFDGYTKKDPVLAILKPLQDILKDQDYFLVLDSQIDNFKIKLQFVSELLDHFVKVRAKFRSRINDVSKKGSQKMNRAAFKLLKTNDTVKRHVVEVVASIDDFCKKREAYLLNMVYQFLVCYDHISVLEHTRFRQAAFSPSQDPSGQFDYVLQATQAALVSNLAEPLDIEFILENKLCLKALLDFADSLYCAENVEFYRDAARFANIPSGDVTRRSSEFKKIMERFIRVGSEREININSSLRGDLYRIAESAEQGNEPPFDSFAKIQRSVARVINDNLYLPFIESHKFSLLQMDPNYPSSMRSQFLENDKTIIAPFKKSFDQLLLDPLAFEYYMAFLSMESEDLSDYFLFFLDVESFFSIRESSTSLNSANDLSNIRKIVDRFIKKDAPMEIAVLDENPRDELAKSMEMEEIRSIHFKILKKAQDEARKVLSGPIFAKFLQSGYCTDCTELSRHYYSNFAHRLKYPNMPHSKSITFNRFQGKGEKEDQKKFEQNVNTDANRMRPDLKSILSHRHHLQYFLRFLTKEKDPKSLRHALFWLRVKHLLGAQKKALAIDIYYQFIDPTAAEMPLEFVTAEQCQSIQSLLKEEKTPLDLFYDLQMFAFESLNCICFDKFLKHSLFKEMLKEQKSVSGGSKKRVSSLKLF